jgi:hypothetical protein
VADRTTQDEIKAGIDSLLGNFPIPVSESGLDIVPFAINNFVTPVANVYTTLLDITGRGFLYSFQAEVSGNPFYKVTVDGVTTVEIFGSGIIQATDIKGYINPCYPHPGSTSLAAIPNDNALIKNYPDTTQTGQIMILPFPIPFKSSLKLEFKHSQSIQKPYTIRGGVI